MTFYDELRRDREAGTPGPFFIQDEFLNLFALSGGRDGQTIHLAKVNSLQLEHTGDANKEAAANLRRFARAPVLEDIALAAEELAKAVQKIADQYQTGVDGFSSEWEERSGPDHIIFGWNNARFNIGMFADAREALAKFRETTERRD